ncbi:Ig-like domain-containing protein, partial [Mycobacterium sp. 852014-52144_SCH5372336]|uniref:Ig-like domain-containing protein n=1 Tax=Mycobacterium sp. 852014-52144_SCH5372336 TaxID=1834115 RepID=UPI000AA2E860
KDTFTVTIDDGHGGLITKQVTVTIQPQNAGPTSAPVYNGFANGVHYGSTGSADADGDTLTYQITGAATNGTASIDQTLGTYTYVATSAARNAAANTPGTDTDSFTFTVSDGHGGLITKTVTVEIMPTGVITDIPKATGSSTMYVSPDGGRVLMTTRDSSTGTTRTKVTVYNSSTSGAVGTPVFVDGDTPSVFFTPDGTAAVVRTTNGNTTTFAAITLANGSLRGGGAASVTGNAEHRFDADSKTVVVAGENYSGSTAFTNFAILTPTTTSTFTVNAAGGYGGGWVVQLSPDRARAVAAIDRYDDTGITYAIVNTATGEVLSTPTLVGDEYMLGLTFAGNGRVVLSTKTYPDVDDPTVRMAVFNTVTGAAVGPVRTLTGYEMSVPAVSPTGNRVVLGTHPGNALQTTIMIVDTATGAIVGGAPTVLNDFATGAQFNADGTKVFLPTWINPSIKTIDATTGAVVATTPTYSGYGRGVVWNDDRTRGLFIVETTTGDTLVVPFNATTGTAISSGVTISGKLEGGDLRPDGQRMTFYTETQTYNSATGLYDTIARVSVLNVSSGALVNSVTIFSGPSTNSAVSFVDSGVGPNNRVVVAYSSRTNATDGASSIAVIDTTNGTIVGTPLQLSTYGGYASRPQMSTNGVGAVMWAAEGYDFTANKYTGIKLIAANTQTGRITVAPTANDIYDLRVSADGSRAAGATSTATATETTSQVTVVNTSTGTVSTTSYTGTDKAVLNFTASGLQVSVPTATGMRIYLIPG